ncbi:MAG: BF3164 family lipoprotein [Longimicrobiales bacterium]
MLTSPADDCNRAAAFTSAAGGRTGPLATIGCCVVVACAGADSAPSFDHAGLPIVSLEAAQLSVAPAIGKPTHLRLQGQTLWVSDMAADPGLHALDAETGELLYSTGRKGEGPGEFSGNPFGLEIAPGDTSGIWAFDLQFQRLTRFERRPLALDKIPTIHLRGTPRVTRVVWITPDSIVGLSASAESRFSVFGTDGSRLKTVAGQLIGPEDGPHGARLSATTAANKACRWPGRGFVIVNFMVGRIEYYDAQARFVRLAKVPFPSEPIFAPDESGRVVFRTPRRWYLDCATSNQFLYALFSGRLQTAYDGDARASGEYVHVFDWNGDLHAVFRLDRATRPITVNPGGDVLYVGSLVDAGIYRYQLPSISEKPIIPPKP